MEEEREWMRDLKRSVVDNQEARGGIGEEVAIKLTKELSQENVNSL